MLLRSQSRCLCTQAAIKMWCFLPQREGNLPRNACHAAEITEQVSPHHLPHHLTPLCSMITHHIMNKLKLYTLLTNLTNSTFLPPNPVSSNQRTTISETSICCAFVCCVFVWLLCTTFVYSTVNLTRLGMPYVWTYK